jgi:hypothetical protein
MVQAVLLVSTGMGLWLGAAHQGEPPESPAAAAVAAGEDEEEEWCGEEGNRSR